MPVKKTLRNRFTYNRIIKNSRGISPVISTIIISGTLLIILVIASFVSTNVLELQIASTEFEQAKTNMMLLDEIVQDVALRRGSGGYVQFNQRSGGIGINEHTEKIKITGPGQQTVVTNSPSATTGGWTNPTCAYADGWSGTTCYAYIQSGTPSTSQAYSKYGFNIPTDAKIEKVKVRYDAWTGGDEQIRVDVSWDGGTTWSLKQITALNTAETTYWYDVTTATSWTPDKLSDTNFRVRVDAYTVGTKANEVRLDWIPVEVTYASPSIIYESPSLMSLVYRGGSYVSGSDITLRGNNSLIVNMTSALSYLRVETGQGVWIKLDYYRVRIVETGTLVVGGTLHNFIEIAFLRIERGKMGGSGTVNVKVQNIDVYTITREYPSNDVTIHVQLGTNPPESRRFFYAATINPTTVVMFTEIVVQVSTA